MARSQGYVKPTGSCGSCLTCYMFDRGHNAAACTGCRRNQPLNAHPAVFAL